MRRVGRVAGDRLTSSEKRALLLWIAAGIIGLLFAHKYFFQAFPEASVNFQVRGAKRSLARGNFSPAPVKTSLATSLRSFLTWTRTPRSTWNASSACAKPTA